MLSEAQLHDWEQRCDTHEFADIECHIVVPLLIAEVRRLKAYEPVGEEFDWGNDDD